MYDTFIHRNNNVRQRSFSALLSHQPPMELRFRPYLQATTDLSFRVGRHDKVFRARSHAGLDGVNHAETKFVQRARRLGVQGSTERRGGPLHSRSGAAQRFCRKSPGLRVEIEPGRYLMAASLVTMLPVVVLFFFAQRLFIEGITLTGVRAEIRDRRSEIGDWRLEIGDWVCGRTEFWRSLVCGLRSAVSLPTTNHPSSA